jgi:hypothetical protein
VGFYTKIPTGIAIMAWPGNKGAKPGKKHCPTCGECRKGWCWKKSEEHVACVRHVGSQPAPAAQSKPKGRR